MNKDLQRYKLIIERFISDPTKLSDSDLSFFVSYLPNVDEKAMQDILSAKEGVHSPEAVNNALQQMSLLAISKPEYKQKMMDFYQTKKAGQVAGNVRNALNTALSAVDIGLSSAQIGEARRALRRSRRPERPTPLTAEPLLQGEIAKAQQGDMEAARTLAPAQQAILDSYLADMANATTASGGQAGIRGALGQVASTRRQKAINELAPMADRVRARQQARLDNLINMKLSENQAIQQSQAQYYPTDVQAYLGEQNLMGDALAQGRQNFRAALGNIGQAVPDMYAQAAIRRRTADIYNKMSPYGENIANLAAQALPSAIGLKELEDEQNRIYRNYNNMV